MNRIQISIISASALIISMIAGYEKYVPNVYMPTPQDVPTIGYGTTVNPDTGKRIAFGDQKNQRSHRETLANERR